MANKWAGMEKKTPKNEERRKETKSENILPPTKTLSILKFYYNSKLGNCIYFITRLVVY